MVRGVVCVGLAACWIALTHGLGGSAFAQSAEGAKTLKGALFAACLQKQFPNIQYDEHSRIAFDPDAKRNFAYENGKWIDVKTGKTVCPDPTATTGAKTVKGALFAACLQKKIPNIQYDERSRIAFDPDSKRNFAYENGAWIDTKTLRAVCPEPPPQRTARPVEAPPSPPSPQVGMLVMPLGSNYALTFSVGPTFTRYSSSYSSTGSQAPDSSSSRTTGAAICGGFTAYYPTAGNAIEYGGGLNICGDTTGATKLFDIVRHPGSGHVSATVNPGVRLEPFVGIHVPINAGPVVDMIMRVGPVFANNTLSITSDQTGAGGRLETASNSVWTTGAGLTLGAMGRLCTNCVFNGPLNFGVLGKVTWLPASESARVTSSAFGFTETASIDRATNFGVLANVSVPFGSPR